MSFTTIFLFGFLVIMIQMTLLWLVSIRLKNVSIVDPFWGLGFVVVATFYFVKSPGDSLRAKLVLVLVAIWGVRLFLHLLIRNWNKGEDYRYAQFRQDYGATRYWWFSFFQVFLLQGFLLWIISAPLLASMYYGVEAPMNTFDLIGIVLWSVGFIFEAGGDYQLSHFKKDPTNKGKLLTTGLWQYTRHPNYFGDAAIWWGFGFFSFAVGSYAPILSTILMSWLLLKVSGVALLERNLKQNKPGYEAYIQRTSAFIPWFPKSKK